MSKINLSLDSTCDFMIEKETVDLREKIRDIYPLIYRRLNTISRMPASRGKLPNFVKTFYIGVIEFCLDYKDKCSVRNTTDYDLRTQGEMKSQFYPNMPLIKERYELDNRSNGEKDNLDSGCNKLFTEGRIMNGGIFCC